MGFDDILLNCISLLFIDTLDTLDILLFGKNKNKNIIFYDNWYLLQLQQQQQKQQQQQNNIFTSKLLIKDIFFLPIYRVSTLSTLSRNKEGELTNDY